MMSICGQVYRVKVTLKNNATDGQGNRTHSYEATKIELLDGQNEQAVTSSRNSNNSISGAKSLNRVEKSYKKGEYLLDESKKVSKDGENGRDLIAKRDKEYADAVAAGDMEKVDAMLREEAARKGYSENSDYQGSLAFNGAAPSKNG